MVGRCDLLCLKRLVSDSGVLAARLIMDASERLIR